MGCSSGSVETFAQIVEKTVTAVNAVSDLATITSQFIALGGEKPLADPLVATVDPQSVLTQLKSAMASGLSACNNAFKGAFPSVSPAGSDNGLVWNYTTNPDLNNVVNQIAQNFSNWGITLSAAQIQDMANTMAQEVASKMGATSTSYGIFSLGMNSQIDWAIAYGTFPQNDDGAQALVYAFAAAEATNWGEKPGAD